MNLDNISSNLIYEIQKAFFDERGEGARYRMVRIGVEYVEKELGKNLKDMDTLLDGLKKLGFVEDISFSEEDVLADIEVKGCAFKQVRDLFMDKGLQPLSCPVANIVMDYLEKQTGLSPERLPISREGNVCKVSLAKMATSDVVTE